MNGSKRSGCSSGAIPIPSSVIWMECGLELAISSDGYYGASPDTGEADGILEQITQNLGNAGRIGVDVKYEVAFQ
ncbi:MAG: hypothetical protein QM784_19580 [Polyangiaceae bacterium]